MWISKRYCDFLETQLAFWQDRAEAERVRADRAVDLVSQFQGQLPISDIGLQDHGKNAALKEDGFAERLREVDEMFNEQIGDLVDAETGE